MQTRIVQLEKGGHVAVDEYGDPDGIPVFFCHGWPSSRTMAVLADQPARDLGLRIISPDRPGIYGSAFQSGRKLLDWPALVHELAVSLGITAFRILAISGGAPYAYATGWALPDEVRVIAVVSGAPPISELSDHGGLLRLYRWMLGLHRTRPELLRKCFYLARPFASTRLPLRFRPLLLKLLQSYDAEALRDSRAFEAFFESQRQAWRGSTEGVLADAEIYALPWGFPIEEVRVPVRLWHGTSDRTFSYRLAEEVARRLPQCDLHLVDGAGHYSLPIRHMDKILADLKSAGR